MTRGLVLGKFMPYHLGHTHLIREARRQCDELVVLVWSEESDVIPGGVRYQWVRRSHPECRVIHVDDVLPNEPSGAPDFWPRWAEAIGRHVGKVDRLFTSEDYGDTLAARLGATHTCVDRTRRVVPVSGTAVLENPWKNWQYLPRVVRPYMTKRIAIVGGESCGKTTLAQRLAARYNTTWAYEYGRDYCLTRDAMTLETVDFETIVWAQATLEEEAALDAGPVCFCDTDLHTTCTWTEIVTGSCPEWLIEAARARQYDLVLLLAPDVPWVGDGVRVLEGRRFEHHAMLERELRNAGRTWVDVHGTFEEREARAIAAVERVLRGPW